MSLAQRLTSAVLVAMGLWTTVPALACDQVSVPSTSDQALKQRFAGSDFCPMDYIQWQAKKFNVPEKVWKGSGYDDACNFNKEYAKHWSVSRLIELGPAGHNIKTVTLPDGKTIFLELDRAWHNNSRHGYNQLARGIPQSPPQSTLDPEDAWHDEFLSLIQQGTHLAGEYSPSPHFSPAAGFNFGVALYEALTSVDWVSSFCTVFNPQISTSCQPGDLCLWVGPNPDGTASARAATLVHEGFHAHLYGKDDSDHVDCTEPGFQGAGACDLFFPHRKDAYGSTDLYKAKDRAGTKQPGRHSVFQLEHEFACDLIDRPGPWVPVAIASDAQDEATWMEQNRFVNRRKHTVTNPQIQVSPPFACGDAAPMGAPPPATCSAHCATDTQCVSPDGKQGACVETCCQFPK